MATTKTKVAAGSGVVGALALGASMLLTQPKCGDPGVVCLKWQASTQWTDNKPITTPVTYRVYRGKGTAPKAVVANVTGSLELMLTEQPSGNQCFQLTALAKDPAGTAMLESDRTGDACKVVPLPAPTDGSIEAPTDGSIEN